MNLIFTDGEFEVDRLDRVHQTGNRINVDFGIVYRQRRFRRLAALKLKDLEEFYYEP